MKRILTAAMAAIMTLGAFAFTGCDNVQILQRPTNTNTSGSATDFERGEFIVGESTNTNGVSLLGAPISSADFSTYNIPQQAESAVLVTATVSPATTANYIEMSWKVAWKNPSSAWASGKTVTDYVTVSKAGNLTATVTCLQPFGEQVVVTATASQGDGSKSASLKCDYMKRYADITIATATVSDADMFGTQDGIMTAEVLRGGGICEGRMASDSGMWAEFSGSPSGYLKIFDFGEETDYTVSTNNYTVTLTLEEHVAEELRYNGFDVGTGSISFDSSDFSEVFEHDWFVLPGADGYAYRAWYEIERYGGTDAQYFSAYNNYISAINEGLANEDNVDGYVCYITIALTSQDKSTVYETYKIGCSMSDGYLPAFQYEVNSVTLDGDITF